jgi:hypothetical protein
VEKLREANPMLGHRGCRLGITHPEIYGMQVRAIMEAACTVAERGGQVEPEIMIPLTGTVGEMKLTYEQAKRIADGVVAETGVAVKYSIGTMIEVPRAALIADQIAQHAEFFSFGTNDLTQMTFGYSRDDVAKFLPDYLQKSSCPRIRSPSSIRRAWGRSFASHRARTPHASGTQDRDLCEHGGEPSSVEFCHRVGMTYVSCSPFMIPIARLAAAPASDHASGRAGGGVPVADLTGVFVPVTHAVPRATTSRRIASPPTSGRWNASAARGLRRARLDRRVPAASECRARPSARPAARGDPADRRRSRGNGRELHRQHDRRTKRAGRDRRRRGHRDHAALLHARVRPRRGAGAPLPRRRRRLADPGDDLQLPAQHRVNLEAATVAASPRIRTCAASRTRRANPAVRADRSTRRRRPSTCWTGPPRRCSPRWPSAPRAGCSRWRRSRPASCCDVFALARQGRWDEARGIAARMMPRRARRLGPLRDSAASRPRSDLQGLLRRAVPAPLPTPDGDAIEDIKELLATTGLAVGGRQP